MKIPVQFFQPHEFQCRCGCGAGDVSAALVAALEVFRRAWGMPVRIHSGRRCSTWNAQVGGALRSRHMLGCAADIGPVDRALLPAFRTLADGMFSGLSGWEVRIYPTFVHVAVPRVEEARMWRGGAVEVLAS